jgi:hypothetical protein
VAEAALHRGVAVRNPVWRRRKINLPEIKFPIDEGHAVNMAAGVLSHFADQPHGNLGRPAGDPTVAQTLCIGAAGDPMCALREAVGESGILPKLCMT